MTQENTTTVNVKAHPFEISGCGRGPFEFITGFSLPSSSLAEANPEAYNNALRDIPPNLGTGTCAHCGRAIMNNFVIADADGKRFVVGSDCVEKIDDPALGEPVKIAAERMQRAKRRAASDARKEKARLAYLAQVCNAQGETNAARIARENSERLKEEARRKKAALILEPLAAALSDRGPFANNIARDLRVGLLPFGRGLDIMLEILGKIAGRYNSRAYWIEIERCEQILETFKATARA